MCNGACWYGSSRFTISMIRATRALLYEYRMAAAVHKNRGRNAPRGGDWVGDVCPTGWCRVRAFWGPSGPSIPPRDDNGGKGDRLMATF